MPFDGADFRERRDEPEWGKRDDTIVTVIIVVVAMGLLFVPISIEALADIVIAVQGR
jgi:hypothetical protein